MKKYKLFLSIIAASLIIGAPVYAAFDGNNSNQNKVEVNDTEKDLSLKFVDENLENVIRNKIVKSDGNLTQEDLQSVFKDLQIGE